MCGNGTSPRPMARSSARNVRLRKDIHLSSSAPDARANACFAFLLDEIGGHTYVALVEVLLLLTALFASLTGAGSGDRSVRPVQGMTVVRAAEVAQSVVRSARHKAPLVAVPQAPRVERNAWPRLASAQLPVTHLPFERRLE